MEGRIGIEDPLDRWYNVFQRLLSRAHPEICFPIVNSAVGGESTREIMSRFDHDILPHNPDICFFMIGGNNHDCRNPSRILVAGELQALAASFVARIPRKTKTVGVVLNPIVDDWHFASKHPAYRDRLAQYGDSLDASLNPDREFARSFYTEQDWPYLDLYTLMIHDPEKYVLPQDGIHMNLTGHALFAQKMFEIVDKLMMEK